jgi:hypothetical protein
LVKVKTAISRLIDDLFSLENWKSTFKCVLFEVSAVRDTPLMLAPLAKEFFIKNGVDVSGGG